MPLNDFVGRGLELVEIIAFSLLGSSLASLALRALP